MRGIPKVALRQKSVPSALQILGSMGVCASSIIGVPAARADALKRVPEWFGR